jgi:hypothetical protein
MIFIVIDKNGYFLDAWENWKILQIAAVDQRPCWLQKGVLILMLNARPQRRFPFLRQSLNLW